MAFTSRMTAPRHCRFPRVTSTKAACFEARGWRTTRLAQLRCHAFSERDENIRIDALKDALKDAVQREDYTAAAALKKQLETAEGTDPVTQLETDLKAAIEKEDYKEAAAVRDRIKDFKQNQLLEISARLSQLSTTSDTCTNEVRVTITSTFVPQQSVPERERFLFQYQVKVLNESSRSDRVVKLQNRHWKITDARGKVEHVRGPGVVGKQPVLQPGEDFEYTSFAILKTPIGSMEGEFEMLVLDVNMEVTSIIEAKIGCFGLQASL